MNIDLFDKTFDNVIKSIVLTGKTTYEFAINSLFPLINRFSAQRKLQNPTFYERLRSDLTKGCVMPAITLAFISESDLTSMALDGLQKFVNDNVDSGYVLDGMQRLNALNTVKNDFNLKKNTSLYLTIIIAKNKDMLLYRMITLNNGQKAMTPRHQIEVLTEELFDFTRLNIDVQTEKERAERITRGAFNLADISKGYLAFFTNSVHNDNNKIISEKMDEIIVGKIMKEAVVENGIQFQDVLNTIDKFAENEKAKKWLQVQNNLIGFCVGIKKSFDYISTIEADEFGLLAEKFEEAFRGMEPGKINLGKYRRELSMKYIEKIGELKNYTNNELLGFFSDETAQ